MISKQCIICGDEFVCLNKNKKGSFCSKICREKNRREYLKNKQIKIQKTKISINCIICNKLFIKKTVHHKYCSKECLKLQLRKKYFEENYSNYIGKSITLNFYKIRFEIFKRDNFTCQYCGRNVKEDKIKLHLEHVIPKNKGGDNSINNLTTSCEECNLGKGDVLLEEHLIKKA